VGELFSHIQERTYKNARVYCGSI